MVLFEGCHNQIEGTISVRAAPDLGEVEPINGNGTIIVNLA